jgi:tyrosyl-tRNA synthetase
MELAQDSTAVTHVSLVAMVGEANRMAAAGGLYLNGKKVTDPNMILTKDHLLQGKFCVIGMGKTEKKILYLLPDT